MATFNPPYNMDVNFNGDMDSEPTVIFTDKDGKVVDKSEVDAYSAWIEANPPVALTE